jgi:CO/xanthine dehydrogenase Mo-binding subunit
VHAVVVRSLHAHAWIHSIDLERAKADPRVLAVLTGADIAHLPPLDCIDAEETTKPFNQPILAQGKVRYVASRLRSSSRPATATSPRTCST